MRIAISMDNDDGYDTHVLATHLPHPENGGSTPFDFRIAVGAVFCCFASLRDSQYCCGAVIPDVKCDMLLFPQFGAEICGA